MVPRFLHYFIYFRNVKIVITPLHGHNFYFVILEVHFMLLFNLCGQQSRFDRFVFKEKEIKVNDDYHIRFKLFTIAID